MLTTVRAILFLPIAALTLFGAAGCGNKDQTPTKTLHDTNAVLEARVARPIAVNAPPAIITTILDQSTVTAGTDVNATCEARDASGNIVPGFVASISSSPPDGITISGMTISTRVAGDYFIACSQGGTEADVVPAQLTVNPGPAVAIVIGLDQYNVRAGTQVMVVCDVRDQFDNPVDAGQTFTSTPEPSSRDTASVTPTVPGDYTLACVLPGPGGLASEPVSLHVDAGLAARLTITGVTPQNPIYRGGAMVALTAGIFDRFDNAVTATWRVVGNPPSSIVPSGHGAVLLQDGRIELVAEVTSPTEGGRRVSDSRIVTVDARPPDLDFTSPTRAQLLVGTPGNAITLRGRVSDIGSGVASLVINGQMVSFDASGLFTATMVPRWGVNLIQGTAIDGVGNQKNFVQSFELASRYRQANATAVASHRIADGILAHLGQAAFDDGDADIDDLSTIARLVIQRANLAALIPNPITNFHSDCSIPFIPIRDDLRLFVDSVTFGTPVVHMSAVNGGVRMHVEVPNVRVNVHTRGGVCQVSVNVDGNATASRVTLDGVLNISSSGGVINVSMPRPAVRIDNLSVHINLPSVISWAVDGIISLFTGAIRNQVTDAFATTLQQSVPPVLRDFLRSIDLGTGFDLPAPLNFRLNVDAAIARTSFDGNGATLGLDSTIYATRGMINPEPLGGILQESRSNPAFRTDRSIGVAISYDLVNQALYSLWYGGGLNLDITSLASSILPLPGVQVRLQGLAPPVLVPTTNPTYPFKLQAGDLKITAIFPGSPPITATIYGTIELDANVTLDARGNFQIAIGPNPSIALEVDIPPEALIDGAMLATVISSSLRTLLPQVVGNVLGGIPIPRLQLSQLISGLPPGLVLGLISPTMSVNSSYLVLEGTLEQLP